ncbi:MAG TPA: MFS transporter [Gaiellaceae bacterium]|nr:MFS transporter [Gaiellaceae bacterium]
MRGDGPRAVGFALLAALAASQAALVVLNPLLPDVASDLGVSVATAGQLRTVSGFAAGIAALTAGLWATRLGLRGLLVGGVLTLALGSVVSAVAPDFPVLIAAQVLAGFGIGISYSAAVAATAEWSTATDRSRVLAIALLGPPLAWIVGMPLVGIVGEVSWRLAWLVVPVSMALVAIVLLLGRPATPPADARAGLRAVFGYQGVLRWSMGELLAFSGWAGALVYVGALLVDSYGLSIAATGLALGFGALIYVPGNFLFRRWVDAYSRRLLAVLALSAAATVAVLYAVRPSVWFTIAAFAVLSFIAGGRTLAGSARGLGLAPELRLGVTGVRTAALQSGYFVGAAVGGIALAGSGYSAVGLAFAALFVGAAIPHLVPLR